MRGVYTVEVIDMPDALRQLRSGQHPAASQSAQPVGFRQAACDQELLAQMKRWTRTFLEQRLQIHFIYQHQRIGVFRDISDRAQRFFLDESPGWIVQIGDYDQ